MFSGFRKITLMLRLNGKNTAAPSNTTQTHILLKWIFITGFIDITGTSFG
jgi:hypothetical protein